MPHDIDTTAGHLHVDDVLLSEPYTGAVVVAIARGCAQRLKTRKSIDGITLRAPDGTEYAVLAGRAAPVRVRRATVAEQVSALDPEARERVITRLETELGLLEYRYPVRVAKIRRAEIENSLALYRGARV